MRNSNAKAMAFCGVSAALAVTLGCLGGMIPVATYVIPVLQCVVLQLVFGACGRKLAWVWYVAVSLLGLLLCPDKEAAAVFVFLGYYPLVKPFLDRTKPSLLWKLLLFLVSMGGLYLLLSFVLGLEELNQDMTAFLWASCLILGAVTFLLLDRLLSRLPRRRS